MMYNDKVGYGPTVSDALDRAVRAGRRRDGDRSGAGGQDRRAGARCGTVGRRPAAARRQAQQGRAPEVPTSDRGGPRPGGPTQLSAAKAAALQDVQTAMGELRTAQQSGNFEEFGTALQRLDDAMKKYNTAK